MNRLRRWFLCSALVALAVAAYVFLTGPRVGRRNVAVVRGAGTVEVFRIETPELGCMSSVAGEKKFDGYTITAQGKDQGTEFAQDLADILADNNTYSNVFVYCYAPGVAFRAWKGQDVVDVVICFKCNNFYCGPPTEWAKENASFWDLPARARLVRLAKQAFPDDKAIQSLTERQPAEMDPASP